MPTLGNQLFDEVRPEFFRLLANRWAPAYVDLLDVVDSALATAPEGLPMVEIVALAQEVIEKFPALSWEEPTVPDLVLSATPRANLPRELVHRLLDAGWIEKPARNDFREVIFLDPNGKILLSTLKRLSRPGEAVFTDPLEMVAKTLTDPDGFRDNPWGTLQACLNTVNKGLEDLEQMGKAVARLTRRQVHTQSLAENLSRVFEEFSRKFAHTCYRELIRTRLHTRLPDLLNRLDTLTQDETTLLRMREELLRRQSGQTPTDAARVVREAFDQLRNQLSAIPTLADRVDQHTAEFARRSLARFRYLQEIGTQRREAILTFFEQVKTRAAGRRLVDIEDDLGFPPLRLIHAQIFAGLGSLFPPRRSRGTAQSEPIDGAATNDEADTALAEVRRNLRDSLSVHRANRFISTLLGNRGARISVRDLPLHTSDDLEDLIAVLLNAGSRDAKYHLVVPRVENDGHAPHYLEKMGYRIEDFELCKTTDAASPSNHG